MSSPEAPAPMPHPKQPNSAHGPELMEPQELQLFDSETPVLPTEADVPLGGVGSLEWKDVKPGQLMDSAENDLNLVEPHRRSRLVSAGRTIVRIAAGRDTIGDIRAEENDRARTATRDRLDRKAARTNDKASAKAAKEAAYKAKMRDLNPFTEGDSDADTPDFMKEVPEYEAPQLELKTDTEIENNKLDAMLADDKIRARVFLDSRSREFFGMSDRDILKTQIERAKAKAEAEKIAAAEKLERERAEKFMRIGGTVVTLFAHEVEGYSNMSEAEKIAALLEASSLHLDALDENDRVAEQVGRALAEAAAAKGKAGLDPEAVKAAKDTGELSPIDPTVFDDLMKRLFKRGLVDESGSAVVEDESTKLGTKTGPKPRSGKPTRTAKR